MLALRRIRFRISIRVFCSENCSRVTGGVLGGFVGRDGLVGLVHITFKNNSSSCRRRRRDIIFRVIVMIDKDTADVLKFIAANQPCSFDDIERKFGEDFRYSAEINFIDKNLFWRVVDRSPDGQPLLALTPEGKAAIEEYQRSNRAERRATIAIVIAFVALFKPASIDLFEFTKKIVLALLKLMQS